ncbi:thermonuclease family protein [Aestuariivirga sp.]|uniref:thermonuclease family protein n=1 Tax=Aestuariivirga sp. TaxID=2650926 RepID=UPI0039E55635
MRASQGDWIIVIATVALFAVGVYEGWWMQPQSGDFTAIDGDSLRKDGNDTRLFGIDAPELHQFCAARDGKSYACGQDAKLALQKLVRGKTLTCRPVDTDRYGRTVAVCRDGGLDIGREMVRQGFAIAYLRHSMDYAGEEADARAAKRGIWQGAFEDPEDWRAEHRSGIGG